MGDFPVHPANKRYRRGSCRACWNAHIRLRISRDRDAHLEKRRALYHLDIEKGRSRCRAYYHGNASRIKAQHRGKYGTDECREAARRYRLEHLDHYRILHRAASAKRRALKAGASVGPVNYAVIKERDGMICHICGQKVSEGSSVELGGRGNVLSFDHLMPLSQGGSHTEQNLAVAHQRCNSRRQVWAIPANLRLF